MVWCYAHGDDDHRMQWRMGRSGVRGGLPFVAMDTPRTVSCPEPGIIMDGRLWTVPDFDRDGFADLAFTTGVFATVVFGGRELPESADYGQIFARFDGSGWPPIWGADIDGDGFSEIDIPTVPSPDGSMVEPFSIYEGNSDRAVHLAVQTWITDPDTGRRAGGPAGRLLDHNADGYQDQIMIAKFDDNSYRLFLFAGSRDGLPYNPTREVYRFSGGSSSVRIAHGYAF